MGSSPDLEGPPSWTPFMRPTTSKASPRYDWAKQVELNHIVIKPGPPASEAQQYSPLPQDWQTYVHPEGQRYFYRSRHPKIVTEAYMFRKDVADKICLYAQALEDRLLQNEQLDSDSLEVCLELNDASSDCAYYIVDHATRKSFWLDEVSTEELRIPQIPVSRPHFDLYSEHLYWQHVEYFPMHVALPSRIIDELVRVLGHGRIDHMTSLSSTFPYTASECALLTDTLQHSRATLDVNIDGNTLCAAARIWSVVVNNWFLSFAGEEYCRLSRDQSIVEPPNKREHWFFWVSSKLLFGISTAYLDQLDGIYIDGILYNFEWQKFLARCLDDWKIKVYWGFGSLMSCLLLLSAPSVSVPLGLSSVILSGASIASACYLLVTHQRLMHVPSEEAAAFMSNALSDKYGFLPVASIFALPRALFLWSFTLFIVQVVMLTELSGNVYVQTVATAVLIFGLCVRLLKCRRRDDGLHGRSHEDSDRFV